MKALIFTFLLCTSSLVFAQQKTATKISKLTKITLFHDNGKVAQIGYHLKGKNHGVWKSFDEDGTPVTVGEYNNGVKVGTWLFWANGQIAQVTFQENRIDNVSYWDATADAIVGKSVLN